MFKFTMLFNFQGQGFSESWYCTNGNLLDSQGNLQAQFAALANARNALTALNVLLLGVRLTDLDNPRNTSAKVLALAQKDATAPDTVTNSFLVNVRGVGKVGNRSLFIRGLPDAAIVWDAATESFLPVDVMTKAFDSYKKILTGGNWNLRAVQPLPKPVPGGAEISTIASNPVTDAVVLTTTAAMPDQTRPLIVSGFHKPLTFLNGTYQPNTGYAKVNDSSVTLRNRAMTLPQSLTYVAKSAAIRVQNFAWPLVNQVTILFPRERRTGKAFFVPAGRRRAR